MPEITPLGWLHTVLGAVAIISGIIALVKHKEITLQTRSGQVYLAATLITVFLVGLAPRVAASTPK